MKKTLLSSVAVACLLAAPDLAAAQLLPSVMGPGGTYVPTVPAVLVGYDSGTGLACIIGSTPTCTLQTSGNGGGAGATGPGTAAAATRVTHASDDPLLAGQGGSSAAAAGNTGASTTNGFLRWLRDSWNGITVTGGRLAVDGSGVTQPVSVADVASTGNTLNSATSNAAYTVTLANGEGVTGFAVSGLTASGATLTIEASDDAGTTWSAVNGIAPSTGVLFTTLTTDQQFRVNTGGRTRVRLRVSATGTGTVTISSNASTVSSAVALSSPVPSGTNQIGHVVSDTGSTTAVTGTVAVSAASLPLPSGAMGSTGGTVGLVAGTAVIGHVIVDTAPTTAVTGTFFQSTQPVSAASLPLPSGASTSAKQPALGTAGTPSADVITVQGAASMTALKVDGSAVTQPVSGPLTDAQLRASAVPISGALTDTQLRATPVPVSGTVTATGPLTDTQLRATPVPVSGTVTATGPLTDTQLRATAVPVSGTVTANAGTGTMAVSAASLPLPSGAMQQTGGSVTALPTTASLVSGLTAAMTGTTSTAVTGIGAPGVSLRNYITQLTCGNSHATVGTFVELQDGSGGTTFYTVPAAAVYGGAVINFTVPLKQPTTNTALFVKDTTTGANVICSANGFTGA